MNSKPTIRDVARAAGVSTKTVSRVTNGDAYVAAETAERVREAIERLGYRVNPLARSLRKGQDEAVAIIIESISDVFFSFMVDAVEKVARDAGLFLIVASAGRTADEERAVVNGLLNRSIRGLMIVPSHLEYGDEHFPIGVGGVPVVFVDRPPHGLAADVVMIDNEATARHAAEHLIAHGHRRIAFVGTDLDETPVNMRLAGYRKALEAHGLEYDPGLVSCHRHWMSVDERLLAGAMALDDPPTAVLSGNTVSSVAVVRELHLTRRTDVAVVSFDDFPMADALEPAITVARQDPALMGRRAFELLMDRIDGKKTRARRVVLPTTFIERGSGEIRPVTDVAARRRRRTSPAAVGS
ncbi:MAG TPA: LacI family DNA-binding transcriptional regulator [Solirubrobacteraceae bacterium]|nr:LacI family DNA-binding transcriptional regulator [Solirubrobacteraceae bacterium]